MLVVYSLTFIVHADDVDKESLSKTAVTCNKYDDDESEVD